MAGPAEDHAVAEITADADHVGTMISAAGEPRVVRVAHITTGMSVALLAVTIARAVMMIGVVGERRIATADPVMNVTIARAEIRDHAAVSGTVQHRPRRSVLAIPIRSAPSRLKCLAKCANQKIGRAH